MLILKILLWILFIALAIVFGFYVHRCYVDDKNKRELEKELEAWDKASDEDFQKWEENENE